MTKVIAVLPAYNEAGSIGSLLQKYQLLANDLTVPLQLIVVNDGSTDDTVTIVKSIPLTIPLHLIDNNKNAGLGAVLKQGILYAIQSADANDMIVTMDSDDSHDPQLIVQMKSEIDAGVDIVIASRYRQGSKIVGLSTIRKWISFGAVILFKLLAPISNVRDYTCGYRGYKVELIHRAFKKYGNLIIEEKGFSCMAELLLKLSTFAPVVKELPFTLRYDLKKGASKMKIGQTIKQTLKLIYTYRTNSLIK